MEVHVLFGKVWSPDGPDLEEFIAVCANEEALVKAKKSAGNSYVSFYVVTTVVEE